MNIMSKTLLFIGSLALSFMANSASELKQAPDFQLKDSNGKIHRLADYKGQSLVLHFWATWCPYCKKLQPGLDRLYKNHTKNGSPNLKMLGISFRVDDGATPGKALAERGISFLTLVNGDSVANAYHVRGTPTTVFINRDGKIVWTTNTSNPNDPKLEQAANYILMKRFNIKQAAQDCYGNFCALSLMPNNNSQRHYSESFLPYWNT